jgi:hypothetical protein
LIWAPPGFLPGSVEGGRDTILLASILLKLLRTVLTETTRVPRIEEFFKIVSIYFLLKNHFKKFTGSGDRLPLSSLSWCPWPSTIQLLSGCMCVSRFLCGVQVKLIKG